VSTSTVSYYVISENVSVILDRHKGYIIVWCLLTVR